MKVANTLLRSVSDASETKLTLLRAVSEPWCMSWATNDHRNALEWWLMWKAASSSPELTFYPWEIAWSHSFKRVLKGKTQADKLWCKLVQVQFFSRDKIRKTFHLRSNPAFQTNAQFHLGINQSVSRSSHPLGSLIQRRVLKLHSRCLCKACRQPLVSR